MAKEPMASTLIVGWKIVSTGNMWGLERIDGPEDKYISGHNATKGWHNSASCWKARGKVNFDGDVSQKLRTLLTRSLSDDHDTTATTSFPLLSLSDSLTTWTSFELCAHRPQTPCRPRRSPRSFSVWSSRRTS